MNWNETRQFFSRYFPEEVSAEMEMLLPGELQEIRIRADRPTVFVTSSRTASLPWSPDKTHLNALVEAFSEHSLYARADETSRGYITLRGGHRLGLCGQTRTSDARSVLSDIGSVCIRIAGEWPGCADMLLEGMVSTPQSLLIIGPPGAGKTTILRDLARQIASNPWFQQVTIVDERSELAACVDGVPQLDVGDHSDVLTGLSKQEAIPWLLRSMAPDILITDELGSDADAAAVLEAINSGVVICASAHGRSLQDAAARPALAALMSRRVFDRYVVLSGEGCGQIAGYFDRTGNPLRQG